MMHPKALLFDYGGTLDLPGRHWYWVFEEAYRSLGISFSRDQLREAYVQAERALEHRPLILPDDDFRSLLYKKICLQAEAYPLALSQGQVEHLARWCDEKVRHQLPSTQAILLQLQEKYPMAIVSNFYGNLRSVLQSYGLSPYFQTVTESHYAGIRKPDAALFKLACHNLGFQPHEVCVIGDSYKNDIQPALSIGCSAIWIEGEGWSDTPVSHDKSITSITRLEQLPDLLL